MTNSKPEVFLASSQAAIPLAKKLAKKLEKIANVTPWFDEGAFKAGEVILDKLKTHAQNSDFAVVLFTPDERFTDPANKEHFRPRDNCVFEFGLFMGALGLDPKRCMLVRAADTDLLSDFMSDAGGVIVVNLPVSNSPQQRKKSLDKAFKKIKQNIEELTYCFYHSPSKELRIVPRDRLFDLETQGTIYRSERAMEVVVSSTDPLEVKSTAIARRVLSNMDGKVKYRYFSAANKSSIEGFSRLVRTLAVAPLASTQASLTEIRLNTIMAKHEAGVVKKLNTLGTQLRVFFAPDEQPLHFCVHNAQDRKQAKCYFRYSDETFIQWREGEPAFNIAEELREKFTEDWGDCIFQGKVLYQDERFRKAFREAEDLFPEGLLKSKFKEVCFGNNIN